MTATPQLPTNEDRSVLYYIRAGAAHLASEHPKEADALAQRQRDVIILIVLAAVACISLLVAVVGSNLDPIPDVSIPIEEPPLIRPGPGEATILPVNPVDVEILPPVSTPPMVDYSFTKGEQFICSLFVIAGAVGVLAHLYRIGRRVEEESHQELMQQ